MYNPISTYRLQFHENFTFSDFQKIIPYLQQLGVKTIYASPIFQSIPGSAHGYDGLNPHKIDSEIGTEQQLYEINETLAAGGIGWLQDIVPNHMAFDPANPWLQDVLEKGERSEYASFFDVPWTDRIYHGKIMLPFLGSPLHEVIEKKELQVAFKEPRFVLKYFDTAYPLSLSSYADILTANSQKPLQAIQQLLEQIKEVRKTEEPTAYKEPLHEIQLQLSALVKNEQTKSYIETCIEHVNDSPVLLEEIADKQMYRLCNWQRADRKINFRRFFTINGLICLNMQDRQVFEHYHSYIKKLVEDGVFTGLRVDHVDGLYDPTQYLQHLRELAGEKTYVVVEKILEPGETLLKYWKVQGNTGYDFLAIVNNVFTNRNSEVQLTSFYKSLAKNDETINKQILEKKALILHEYMGGELKNLYDLFIDFNLADTNVLKDVSDVQLKEAIAAFLIHCTVYRFYGNKLPMEQIESEAVEKIFDNIKATKASLSGAVALLKATLIDKPKEGNAAYNKRVVRFYQRMMQFTGPLMAKGVEDTLFYTFNRFIGHNEVGDAPAVFGYSTDEFHSMMIERQTKWRLSINATSTHDTKRGEDVRARLNVLTDVADEWTKLVEMWNTHDSDGKDLPDANERYMIYQTIVGAYPMPGEDEDNFAERLQEFIQKALREAKIHSNWSQPNEGYENAAKSFAVRLLDKKGTFWKTFEPFHKKIADFGIINSLSQVILKFTCPGVPDLYQGTELWDLSLVDPDNRRPVDYEKRKAFFSDTELLQAEPEKLLKQLWQTRYSGAIKQWLVHQLLSLRKLQTQLFTDGEYAPLIIKGEYSGHVLAFARQLEHVTYVVAIPLDIVTMCNEQGTSIKSLDWKNTQILLPKTLSIEYENVFTKIKFKHDRVIGLKDIFTWLPFAVLKLQ